MTNLDENEKARLLLKLTEMKADLDQTRPELRSRISRQTLLLAKAEQKQPTIEYFGPIQIHENHWMERMGIKIELMVIRSEIALQRAQHSAVRRRIWKLKMRKYGNCVFCDAPIGFELLWRDPLQARCAPCTNSMSIDDLAKQLGAPH